MIETKTKQGLPRIHEAEKDGGNKNFVLHPEDNDIFVRTGKQIIEGCRLRISIDVWFNEINTMLAQVQQWAEAHSIKVRSCFFTTKGANVVLYVAPKSQRFDFDLADQIVDLNTELMQKYNVGMIEINQIPWDELDRFLDLETTKKVYGEQPESSPPVGTQP